MLTFQILLDALTNPKKGNISQNALATALEVSTSTVNGWIKKGAHPRKNVDALSKAINECREDCLPGQNCSDFAKKIIDGMEIPQIEKEYLENKFIMHQQKFSAPDLCLREFLAYLIDLSVNQKPLDLTLQYDFLNPNRPIIGVGGQHIVAVSKNGITFSQGSNDFQQCNVYLWRDIVSVSAGWRSSVGLKSDGTCIAVGESMVGNGEIFRWTDIVAVCCGSHHTLGLKRNGTVVSYGIGGDGQCDVSEWKNIQALAAGTTHSVGLRSDGTVIACGSNREGQCEVSSWEHVVQIAAAGEHTVGLTEDGKILFAGDMFTFNFSTWHDVTAIATGIFHVVGLKKDGTVLNTGSICSGQDGVYKWWNIKAIYAGYNTTVGLKSDGTVMVTNEKHSNCFYNTSSWHLLGSEPQERKDESPFELHRKDLIEALDSIHKMVLQLSPALCEHPLDSVHAKLLHDIYDLSKKLNDKRFEIIDITPLADLLLMYNAAFCDFYKSFLQIGNRVDPGEDSRDTCSALLNVIKNTLVELRSL